jgi:hypothetical protein
LPCRHAHPCSPHLCSCPPFWVSLMLIHDTVIVLIPLSYINSQSAMRIDVA